MAKTLIVKGVSYSANKLDTVTFPNVVPCTSISLDKASHTLSDFGETVTLHASVAPLDCTEPIIWTSSNEDVATVVNGVVTSVGVGSCDITATCGVRSATCAITAKAFMAFTGVAKTMTSGGSGTSQGSDGVARLYYDATEYNDRGSLVASTGVLPFYNVTEGVKYYPYRLPKNTKRLKVTTPTGTGAFKVLLVMFCSATVPAPNYPNTTQLIGKTTPSAPTDGITLIDIPTYDGYPEVDAIAINLRMVPTKTEFLESYFNNVTVEFLPDT